MRKHLTGSLVVLAIAALLQAQPPAPPKPGPEHEKLKAAEGEWDCTVHGEKGDSKGHASYKMAVGGLWLIEHFQCEMQGTKFEGRGAISYDAGKKKYVGVWIDSMSTLPMTYEGNLDSEGRMVSTGQMPLPDGKTMKVTLTTVFKDADNKVFTLAGHADGKDLEFVKISYKRKSK